jgi:hypothetical protein
VPFGKCLTFNAIRLPAKAGMGTTGAGSREPGGGSNISLGGHPAATTASDATSRGKALVRVVVVGLGLQAIDDSIESP